MFAEGGSSVVGPLMAKAKGIVLDIGPGAGDWVHLFKAEKEGKMGITKIYGVEPNTALHARLREGQGGGLGGCVRDCGIWGTGVGNFGPEG